MTTNTLPLVAAGFLLFACTASPDQRRPASGEPMVEKYGRLVSDDDVRLFREDALSRIQLARCEQDKPCAPATVDERANPPISILDGRAALAHGIVFRSCAMVRPRLEAQLSCR